MLRWIQRLTNVAAIAVLTTGVAGGLYGYNAGVLPLFSRFGQDTVANMGGYYTNAKGQPFFLFDTDGDGEVDGRWERVTGDRLGNTAGSLLIQGEPWGFAADGTTTGDVYSRDGVEVYNLGDRANLWASAPQTLWIAAWDSLGNRSGDVYLVLEACPDSTLGSTCFPDLVNPGYSPRNWYRVLIQKNEAGTWVTEFADLVDSDKYNSYGLQPGQYRVYMSMIDAFGMANNFVGPVQLNLGDACP